MDKTNNKTVSPTTIATTTTTTYQDASVYSRQSTSYRIDAHDQNDVVIGVSEIRVVTLFSITSVNFNGSGVSLSWNSVSKAKEYAVYRAKGKGSESSSMVSIGTTSHTTHLDTGAYINYFNSYRVVALDEKEFVVGISAVAETYAMCEHLQMASRETINATCTNNGTITYTCTSCGYSFNDTISATGHRTATKQLKSPTCVEDGENASICTICGYVADSWPISATGHSYDSGSLVRSASCETSGLYIYKCHCGDYYYDETPSTGHDYSLAEISPATCTSKGSRIYRCSNCGRTYSEDLPLTGHNYSLIWSEGLACVWGTFDHYECTYCGDIYEVETPPINHNFVWLEDGYGFSVYQCSYCGEYKYVE